MASSNNGNPWFASTIGLLGLIVGYVIASGVQTFDGSTMGATNNTIPSGAGQQVSQAAVPTPPATNDTPATAGDGPFIGKADAPVTVIEFTDFQCPFCQRHYQQTFGEIKTNYVDTGKIKYVVRYFPLSFHPNAEKAAEAAACANEQKKFFEMHAKLFDTQNDWSPLTAADAAAKFRQYATDIGLNVGTFSSCFDSGKTADMIKADMAAGSASGIDGTPGFWILGPNGKNQKISGAYPYATFQSAIDGMMQ